MRSSGTFMKNESAPIWLACARIAAIFVPTCGETSTLVVTSASSEPNGSGSASSPKGEGSPASTSDRCAATRRLRENVCT